MHTAKSTACKKKKKKDFEVSLKKEKTDHGNGTDHGYNKCCKITVRANINLTLLVIY